MRSVSAVTTLLAAIAWATAALAGDADIPFVRTENDAKALGITMPSAANAHIATHYPSEALAKFEQGTAVVEFVVNADGSVSDPRIGTSTGYASLDAASLDSVKAWRFHPATRSGEPVAVRTRAVVKWEIGDLGPPKRAAHDDLDGVTMKPEEFPPDARAKDESGTTVLMIYLDHTGTVARTEIAQSSGYRDLDDAARAAVSAWNARPATLGSAPVNTVIPIRVIWPGDGNAAAAPARDPTLRAPLELASELAQEGITPPVCHASDNQGVYPLYSRRTGEQGRAVASFDVDSGGHVSNIAIAETSGHSHLDHALIHDVEKWRCEPATLNGHAVAVHASYRATWSLR